MQLNIDDHVSLTKLIPPLPALADENFTKGVLIRTRLITWRSNAMHLLAWVCLGLSFFAVIPWRTTVNSVQQFISTLLLQALEQFEQVSTLTQGLQSNFDQHISVNQPIFLVTTVVVFFAVLFFGVITED